MLPCNRFLRCLCHSLVLLALLLVAGPAWAQAPAEASETAPSQDERILQYHSHVTVRPDATVEVREAIVVRALGERIRHGIYRDFPTDYSDGRGNRFRVKFQMVSASRDGQPEPYHTESLSNGVRIYLGDKDTEVPHGVHEYDITYTATRELGFFADHDELYWNATGNDWGFAIDNASADVTLPPQVPRDKIRTEGYTGPQGSKERALTSSVTAAGDATFQATRPLAAEEGLTIVVMWPKGYIVEPTSQEKVLWFLGDNRSAVAALIGLIVVLGYQFIAWFLVGRDPKAGTIMPIYDAPAGLSPAAMRYLRKMGYDNKTFAALLVSLAVKGYLEISQDKGGTYTLTRSRSIPQRAGDEELDTAQKLLGGDQQLVLTQSNHTQIADAIKSLKRALAIKEEKIYFLRNSGWLVPSIALSVFTFLAVVATADPGMMPVALFMSVWLSGWTAGVAGLSFKVVNVWRGALHARGLQKVQFVGAIFLTMFAVPFFLGELFGLVMFATAVSAAAVLVLILLVTSNFVFHELLKAPTHMGRELLDKVDGFKMFLGATTDPAHGGINVNNDITTFERYLPYAIALDVEEAWAAKFAGVLSAAAAAPGGGTVYSPSLAGLYAGGALAGVSSIGGLADSLGSAVASSSSAPGSSSGGGGGGSSGGGGGGGGGGGW